MTKLMNNKFTSKYLLLDLLHLGLVLLGRPVAQVELDAVADVEDNICCCGGGGE